MIFVNLLPDIKLEYVRSLRFKRLLVLLSAVLITCCIIIVSVLFFVANIQQPRQIADIEGTRDNDSQPYEPSNSNNALIEEIKAVEGIREILTIQQQLQTIADLRQDRFVVERLFALGDDENEGYLDTLRPDGLTSVDLNFLENTFIISGKTENDLSAIELHREFQFVGFEPCTQDNKGERIYPFRPGRDVTISTPGSEGEPIPYTIEGSFSPELFKYSFPEKDLVLVIPDKVDVSGADLGQPDHICGLPPTDETTRLDPVPSPDNDDGGGN